jgi:hypothetical protein
MRNNTDPQTDNVTRHVDFANIATRRTRDNVFFFFFRRILGYFFHDAQEDVYHDAYDDYHDDNDVFYDAEEKVASRTTIPPVVTPSSTNRMRRIPVVNADDDGDLGAATPIVLYDRFPSGLRNTPLQSGDMDFTPGFGTNSQHFVAGSSYPTSTSPYTSRFNHAFEFDYDTPLYDTPIMCTYDLDPVKDKGSPIHVNFSGFQTPGAILLQTPRTFTQSAFGSPSKVRRIPAFFRLISYTPVPPTDLAASGCRRQITSIYE